MRTALIAITAAVVTALLVGLGAAVAQTTSSGGMASLKPEMTQHGQRDCVFPAGGWTIVDCSNAVAASSATLTAHTRYLVQCLSDSYISFSGTVADANDGYLPAGAMLPFITTDTERAYSCINISSDTSCRHIECK